MRIFYGCLILIFGLLPSLGIAAALSATWIIPMPVAHQPKSKLCKSLFSSAFSMTSISHVSDSSGQFIPKVQTSIQWDRPEAYDQAVGKILKAWEAIHGYTSPENMVMLAKRDRNLDPMRTSYFLFENAEAQNVGIRVFDASDIVMKNDKPWLEVNSSTSAAPLEVSKPGFYLPERNSGKPFYAWELGLLNADPGLTRGTEFAFTNVATRLDHDYNGSEFMFFGRTKKVQNLNMMIYAQTRARQVSFFEKYGLKPVMKKNETGEWAPVEVAPGMILIAATAKDFIESSFGKKVFTSKKGEAARIDTALLQEQIKHNQQYLTYLEKNLLSEMHPKDLLVLERSMINLLVSAKKDPIHSHMQSERLAPFLSTYFRVVNSVPEKWRDANWESIRKILLYALTQPSPQLAYYYLYLHLTQQAGGSADMNLTPEAEAAFFASFPIPSRLPLGIKPEFFLGVSL